MKPNADPSQLALSLQGFEILPGHDTSAQRDDHHLIWDKSKGWETRITIDVGKKVVGHRLRIRLKTKDREEAIRRRDVVLATCKALKLTVRDRRQARRRKGEE